MCNKLFKPFTWDCVHYHFYCIFKRDFLRLWIYDSKPKSFGTGFLFKHHLLLIKTLFSLKYYVVVLSAVCSTFMLFKDLIQRAFAGPTSPHLCSLSQTPEPELDFHTLMFQFDNSLGGMVLYYITSKVLRSQTTKCCF